MSEKIDFIRQMPLFENLSRGQQRKLANILVRRTFEQGRELVRQGEGGDGLYLLTSGTVDVVRQLRTGEREVVNQLGANDFFGELGLLDDGPRTATVVATADVECYALSRWDFYDLLKDDAEMAVLVLQEVAKRFRTALDTLGEEDKE
jgi:CRP-like cAMP-binding protein